MLTLNLISKELKQEIKLRRVNKLFRKMGYLFSVATIFISISLYAAKTILGRNLDKIVEQTSLVKNNQQSYNLKAKKINSQLNSIADIQKSYTAWSLFLKNLTDKIPTGIKLAFIKVNKENLTVKISGKADNREDLLSAKNNLENLKFIYDIVLPPESLLEKQDINFEISAKIKVEEIINL